LANVVRGERWELSYAVETTYGADPGTSELTKVLGVFDRGTLADPEIEFLPFWGLSDGATRNYTIAYKGKWTMNAAIGDVMLLGGQPLFLPIGDYDSTGTDKAAGGGSALDGNANAGSTAFGVGDATDYATDDYIQVGNSGSTHQEVRKIQGVSNNTITVTEPLWYDHVDGETCNEVEAPFTHTIAESNELHGITMHATFWDADGTIALMRRYHGGKVNRATISAEEGAQLRYSVDEIMFKDISHNKSTYPKYAAGVAEPTPVYPTTEPYYFSMGTLSLNESEFARMRSFRFDINNACEPRFYISDNSGSGRIPYEIREGRREYTLATVVDVSDASLYQEIVQEGTYSSVFKGFQVILTFTRAANDTITITMPPSAPAAGTHAQGCLVRKGKLDIVTDPVVPQELDLLVRSAQIVVVDSVGTH